MNKLDTQINFSALSKLIIGARVLIIEIPCCEIDINNNCYWLEEAQGDTSNEIVKRTQLKLYFEKSSERIEILVGMQRRLIRLSENSVEILHNLTFTKSGELNIKAKHSTNNISRILFEVVKCELWNYKENLIQIYGEDNEEKGTILILKDSTNKEIVIEAFESDDQENCMKLSITNSENKTIQLLKKYNWELIENN